MSEELSLHITGRDGVTRKCGKFVQSVTWSGSVKACARTLELGLWNGDAAGGSLSVGGADSSPGGGAKGGKGIACEMGSRVKFRLGGDELLDGFIFGRGLELGGGIVDLSCADRGLYLKRSEAAYKFKGLTPEAITRRICADFGVTVGALAETGVPINRNFPGVSLYAMIATAYNLAAAQTGERYAIRFKGEALEVVTKRKGPSTLVIKPRSNLRGGTVSESVENMINRVAVYDDNGVRVGTHDDPEAIKLYGLMQAYLKQSKDKDSAKEAQKLLADNGVEQKITVTVNGNHGLISGNCVVMREEVTGLYGLFWIDADSHVWTKDGDYYTKLTLNFKNMMDEQEVGSASAGG